MNPKIDPSLIGIGKSQTHVFGGTERDVLEEQIQKLWEGVRSTFLINTEKLYIYETELITATQGFEGNIPTTLQIKTKPFPLHGLNVYQIDDLIHFFAKEKNVLRNFIERHIGLPVSIEIFSQNEQTSNGASYHVVMLISNALPYDEVLRFVTEDLVRGKNLGIL